MRCVCCNRALNDWESTLKHAETNDYLDTCSRCLDGTGIPYISRNDLSPYAASDDDEEEFVVNEEDE